MKWLTARNAIFGIEPPAFPDSLVFLCCQNLPLHVRIIDGAERFRMNKSVPFIDTALEAGFLLEIKRFHIPWQRKLRLDIDIEENQDNDQQSRYAYDCCLFCHGRIGYAARAPLFVGFNFE